MQTIDIETMQKSVANLETEVEKKTETVKAYKASIIAWSETCTTLRQENDELRAELAVARG